MSLLQKEETNDSHILNQAIDRESTFFRSPSQTPASHYSISDLTIDVTRVNVSSHRRHRFDVIV